MPKAPASTRRAPRCARGSHCRLTCDGACPGRSTPTHDAARVDSTAPARDSPTPDAELSPASAATRAEAEDHHHPPSASSTPVSPSLRPKGLPVSSFSFSPKLPTAAAVREEPMKLLRGAGAGERRATPSQAVPRAGAGEENHEHVFDDDVEPEAVADAGRSRDTDDEPFREREHVRRPRGQLRAPCLRAALPHRQEPWCRLAVCHAGRCSGPASMQLRPEGHCQLRAPLPWARCASPRHPMFCGAARCGRRAGALRPG